jgi:hypothetical protein
MKLNVLERIMLQSVLPKESNYATFRIIMELKSHLSFSETEIKRFRITVKGEQILWQNSEEVEVEIGEKATDIIKTALVQLDKDGKLNEQVISLYEKFMIPKMEVQK